MPTTPNLNLPIYADGRLAGRSSKKLDLADRLTALVLNVANHIETKQLKTLPVISLAPLTVRLPSGGVAVIFRFGCVVLFAANDSDREWLIHLLEPACTGIQETFSEETVKILVDPDHEEGPEGDDIYLHTPDLDRIRIVGEILAKSNQIDFLESRLSSEFDKIEPLALDLADDGAFSINTRTLMKTVGTMLLAEQRMANRGDVTDRFNSLLTNADLVLLHARLEDEYELTERSLLIEHQLSTIGRTATTLLEAIRYSSSHKVEIYILVLIFMELLLSIYGYFFH
jgi:required for meiotic nuclear division protein 1